jgi:hypothetical protein
MKKFILIPIVAALTACSSMTTLQTENVEKKQVPTWYLDHEDFGTQSKAWYKPWDRQGMYYAVAEDVSPSMEMGITKATYKAKRKLADRIAGEMNSRTIIKYDESGTPDRPTGRSTAQDVIVNQIAETVLRTYGIEEKSVIHNKDNNTYRVFVMLKISQQDAQALAAKYDENKQVKLQGRFAGKTIDETAAEVLKQTQR